MEYVGFCSENKKNKLIGLDIEHVEICYKGKPWEYRLRSGNARPCYDIILFTNIC